MTNGVHYLFLGKGKLRQLQMAASILTLRRHWDGPIRIDTDQVEVKKRFSEPGVEVSCFPLASELEGNESFYYEKIKLLERSPFDATIFLDCDTLVTGSLDALFPAPNDPLIRLTVSRDWTVNHQQIRWRIATAGEKGIVHPDRLNALMKADPPAINTGVFAWSKACTFGPVWLKTALEFSMTGWVLWFEELAAQFLCIEEPCRLVSGDWNSLICWGDDPDAKVLHATSGYYGSGRAARLWCEALCECWDRNWCHIREWHPGVDWHRA
jgi:hypothetical protein